eukprot:10557329-Lingulodinium_polyedra.AAC.1
MTGPGSRPSNSAFMADFAPLPDGAPRQGVHRLMGCVIAHATHLQHSTTKPGPPSSSATHKW